MFCFVFFIKVFFPFVTCVIFVLFSFMYKGQSMGIIIERKCLFFYHMKNKMAKKFQISNETDFDCEVLKSEKNSAHVEKLAINKKSTFFVQSS